VVGIDLRGVITQLFHGERGNEPMGGGVVGDGLLNGNCFDHP